MPNPPCQRNSLKTVEPAVSNLTNGERLMLARRRAKKTQEEMRAALGMSRQAYLRLEHDTTNADWTKWFEDRKELGALIRTIDNIELHERCLLSRERQGWTQSELAEKVPCAKQWVHMQETAQQRCDQLLDFWARFWAAAKN